MNYTLQSMQTELRTLVQKHNLTQFHWNGNGQLTAAAAQRYPQLQLNQLQAQAGQGPQAAQNFLVAELTAYCFTCYEKAFKAVGDQVIGREHHLSAAGLYSKVSDILLAQFPGVGGTLFGNGTQGNLLKMDKWATFMNDAWLLGGMHRAAQFRLASPRSLDNLWNQGGGYLVVTAREIIGLMGFGYELQQVGPYQVFRRMTGKSRFVGLLDYDKLIDKSGTFRKTIDLIAPGAKSQQVMAGIRAAGGNTNHGL